MKDIAKVLRPEVQEFIKVHENDAITNLVLKGSPFKDVSIQLIAQQIKGRQIAKQKLPGLYNKDKIIYPPKLNLEQASSEETAKYKSEIVSKNYSLIDLTGGYGIDTLAFSSSVDHLSYCELNSTTFLYATHNFKALNKKIKAYNVDGLDHLRQCKENFDWIFIDPARRDNHSNKVFRLEDCTPNILEHFNLFRSKCSYMMLKLSPLFDLNLSLKQVPHVAEIHIVASKNEVKELLLIVDFENKHSNIKITAVNLSTGQEVFTTNYSDLNHEQKLSLPKTYLYEPNGAIMKSGFYGALCRRYNVSALGVNSHLFTSEHLIDFPGRRFKINKITAPKQKELNKYIPSKKANISTRNYPLNPNQIKKKYKLKDGGSNFVFFTENIKKEKIALICEKIK